ncbi:unnamed protein product [Echinostoma caproni]|uniref:PPM-type phosphatase domain-containing protein n=1 Tax=Echinostoma caproni TaxID=27848 RepID=A0A183A4T2_9TREM|nr:unnamed protein product [Echinostoma caproni]
MMILLTIRLRDDIGVLVGAGPLRGVRGVAVPESGRLAEYVPARFVEAGCGVFTGAAVHGVRTPLDAVERALLSTKEDAATGLPQISRESVLVTLLVNDDNRSCHEE